jgi:3-hydroxyisobutyrate dehydrogenase
VKKVGAAIKERKADMLDAPVDGGREGALVGDLTLFVGGNERPLQRARPVLDSFSKSVVWVGELGSGSVTKIVHNALAMSIDLLLAECLTLGVRSGVALPHLVKVVTEGTALGGNMGLEKRWPDTVFRGDFTARFALKLAHKDFGLAAELAERCGVPTRLIDICRGEISEALSRGWGDEDRTAATRLQEERADVKLRLPSP